ncbi:MAG: hypothetical protein JNL89_04760 [Rhodanobacteraceae bacterium]|nr:hypothetical protein [Rhodanobacteraceae bacterium]
MESLMDQFLALDAAGRRVVHLRLCQFALRRWRAHVDLAAPIRYIETVVGTEQLVDTRLPDDALACAQAGSDTRRVAVRYGEPIAALQDDDLEFPDPVEYAYYAVYNLFRKYALGHPIDDWLIVNQALSSSERPLEWEIQLGVAIRDARAGGPAQA